MEDNTARDEKPQVNWQARLAKVTSFSKLQFANGWQGMRRVWYGIVRFPKLFEALLVIVGLLQGYVLWRTDQALHLAASAQREAVGTADKMRSIFENDQRAWVSASNIAVSGVTWKEGEADLMCQ
jgi:hypothetical protein